MKKIISNIVFTKNRPLQLDAYLESLYKSFPQELVQTYIIYKVELFEDEYEQLFRKYRHCVIIKERDFSSDFLRLLNQIDTKYILFGVDDVVYFDSVDFETIDKTFESFNDIFGFSLRLGKNVLDNGVDRTQKNEIEGQYVYKLNWRQGKTKNTRYPFELCATVYRSSIVKTIINAARSRNIFAKKIFSPATGVIKSLKKLGLARKILKSLGYFYNPNTLESWNCRWCQNHSGKLPAFLYFQKQCASAIQVNIANVTDKKFEDDTKETAVHALNEKYKQGYRFDIDALIKSKPECTHCDEECFKLKLQRVN